MGERTAAFERKTRETHIRIAIDLDDPRPGEPLTTGIPFFDHMLDALRTHAGIALRLEAVGDLEVDSHHLVEDVGIVIGTAVREALGHDVKIFRFGHAYAPLDDALARAVVDVSGRGYLRFSARFSRPRVGDLDTDLLREFFYALAHNARINLHVDLLEGENAHHQVEAVFKATARALRMALEREQGATGVPSTKGVL